jgi:vacuolar-type H+-ATPase subunit I/STV1
MLAQGTFGQFSNGKPVGLFQSVPMKSFYLAVPTKYEDQIIETLGALGSIQLVTDYTIRGFTRVDTVEKCEKYIALKQRITSVLSGLPSERPVSKGLLQSLREDFRKPIQTEAVSEASLDDIQSCVMETERALDPRLETLEKLRSELHALNVLQQNLVILQRHRLRTDMLGDFQYIFVRAGFMNRTFSIRLEGYVEGTSVRFVKWPEKREEDFVVILGLNQDRLYMEETLTRLNFAPLTLPEGIDRDPAQAIEHNRASVAEIEGKIKEAEREIRSIGEEFQKRAADFEPVIHRSLIVEEARSTFSRTETLSLTHGWIPADQQKSLTDRATASTNGAVFLRFNDPGPGDQPPVQLHNLSVSKPFELFTRLRGMPQYREVDPTPIVTVLFTIMYGMMFGDLGQGVVLLMMGVIFSRLQRDFLRIPAASMRRLGEILAACGISAVFFGVLYGEFFLTEAFPPLFLNPIHGQTTMIVMALLFGVAQLTIGLVLKIVNLLRLRATTQAVFGGVRLVYYVTGVVLAAKYVASMSFAVFTENIWLTGVAIGSLILLFLSPAIEGLIRHGARFGQNLMMGVSEFIEVFLSYLTNSISYVRLAAFAIAHSALGLSAVILAGMIGSLPSYIAMNLLAMTIEALGVLIQCMRLTYYEFFTKFYSGGGVAYRPFSLPRVHGRFN